MNYLETATEFEFTFVEELKYSQASNSLVHYLNPDLKKVVSYILTYSLKIQFSKDEDIDVNFVYSIIKKCRKLEVIYFTHSSDISDDIFTFLADCSRLRVLTIRSPNISLDGLKKLREVLLINTLFLEISLSESDFISFLDFIPQVESLWIIQCYELYFEEPLREKLLKSNIQELNFLEYKIDAITLSFQLRGIQVNRSPEIPVLSQM